LALARQHQVRSIGIPSISTGVYRYPKHEEAMIAIREVRHFLENDTKLETVQFVCFSKTDREIYQEILEQGI
ncbi:MAG: macro domain-containing protein, partial [SAR324 cluster bacterium]|nr:macro domain-containing protein [SAR324 cluster bacterium]